MHFAGTLHALADRQAFEASLAPARQAEWVVYATPPFAGPQHVLDDVGRYTHRVAIANTRLLDMEAGQVRFRYQDYRARDHRQKTMTLLVDECMRRFLLHVLPARFQRIRHDGLLGNRHRHQKLARCRSLLGLAAPETPAAASTAPLDYRDRFEALTGLSLRICPVCRHGHMSIVDDLARARRDAAITDTS